MKNHWNDKYDWHDGLGVYIPTEGMVGDELGNALDMSGRAKWFDMNSFWEERVEETYFGFSNKIIISIPQEGNGK